MCIRLGFGRRLASGRVDRLLQLAHLVVRSAGTLHVGILEVDRGRAVASSAHTRRRKIVGHVVEDAGAPLLVALDRLPVRPHAPRRLSLDRTEDVRMPPYELLVDEPRRLLEIALPAFLEQQGEEIDLEKQVAQLVEQLRVVEGDGRVRDLVRLLDRVRDDRAHGLLAIPRAVAPQAAGQLLQLDQGLREAGQLSRWWWQRSS
jgi:hypothetical protein